jgi:hypothetical protein
MLFFLNLWLLSPGENRLPTLKPEITAAELEHHVRTLASDEWRGRFTGTPEALEAGRYLAAVLEKSGARPLHQGQSFLQPVPIRRQMLIGEPRALAAGKPLRVGQDWRHARVSIPAGRYPILIAKSAADLPASGLESKAVLLDTSERKTAREWLAASGHRNGEGIGVLITLDPRLFPMKRPAIALSEECTARVRSGEWKELELELRYEPRDLEAANVVARIPASEPDGTAIVLSAHYDHLQEHEHGEEGADTIYNGADDDASGCAVVLELAGQFAASPPRKRDLIVLLATGEEIGLIGTNHYLDNPPVPLERTLININFEMLGRPDELAGGSGRLWLTGWGETSLGPQWSLLGIPLVADPRPDQNFYRRSDNYAFVERGVMGQTLSSYNMHQDYHTVDDEADRIDYVHLHEAALASHAGLRALFDGEVTPAWTKPPEKSRPPGKGKPAPEPTPAPKRSGGR